MNMEGLKICPIMSTADKDLQPDSPTIAYCFKEKCMAWGCSDGYGRRTRIDGCMLVNRS